MKDAAQFRRWKSCERKRRYETSAEAQCKGQDVYHCHYCDGFHRTAALTTLANTLRKRR